MAPHVLRHVADFRNLDAANSALSRVIHQDGARLLSTSLRHRGPPHTSSTCPPRLPCPRVPLASLPHIQHRSSSHSPISSSGPATRKPVTIQTLQALYKRQEPITVMTAHDFPSAHVSDQAGMDMVLVGDSLAMVAMGLEDTSEVTVDEMIMHCRGVARGARTSFTIGDMPMGSYEVSAQQALQTAIRFVKEGRMKGIKLEGGAEMAPHIERITGAGIPVLAHIGLTPQRQNSLGGFRVQGKTTAGALKVLEDAKAVQAAGAFATIIEAVPPEVAELVTQNLNIPTIGIGAGNGCSGQVLVYVDMTGYFPPGRFLPKFVKKYGDIWGEATRAIQDYKAEVKSRAYPAKEHTYAIPAEELEEFRQIVSHRYGATASAE